MIKDSAAIMHILTHGKGSTLMEENIEELGHGKRFDTYGGEYRGTLCSALSVEAMVTMTVSRQLESRHESMHVCRRHSYFFGQALTMVPPLRFRS